MISTKARMRKELEETKAKVVADMAALQAKLDTLEEVGRLLDAKAGNGKEPVKHKRKPRQPRLPLGQEESRE